MPDVLTALTLRALSLDQAHLEQVAHNLANLQTPGFKRRVVMINDKAYFQAQITMALDVSSRQSTPPITIQTDMHAGALRSSVNLTDLALAGRGFFELRGPQGPLYTRRGDFQVDAQGRLASVDGWPVMGTGGEILLSGSDFTVLSNGKVLQNGQTVAQLRVIDLPGEQLVAQANGVFSSTATGSDMPISEVMVRQGFLEASNVSTAQEMVLLSTRLRHFEGLMRMAQGRDEMLGIAIKHLGE